MSWGKFSNSTDQHRPEVWAETDLETVVLTEKNYVSNAVRKETPAANKHPKSAGLGSEGLEVVKMEEARKRNRNVARSEPTGSRPGLSV